MDTIYLTSYQKLLIILIMYETSFQNRQTITVPVNLLIKEMIIKNKNNG